MTTHSIKLDLDKTLQLPPPTITARQGDTQCGITAMVTDHGAPATLTGYTAKFQAAKPDGTYAEQAAQISGSTVTVELDPQFLAAAGLIRTAYFRFFEGTAEKESTQNMCIRVIHDAEGEAPDLSTSYIPTVDQLVEDATEALNSANTALGNAEEALEDAEAATDSATDAAASANAAANAAQSAIDAMTGNVLRGTVGPSEVVSVDDAYPQVPLGVKVKGATRQNLWVNPSGTKTQNGMTVTPNSDGSITVSGTSTSSALIELANSYALKPGAQYTFSVDKLFPTNEGKNTGGFFIQKHIAGQVNTTIGYLVSDAEKEIVVSVPSDTEYCVFGVQVIAGSQISGTYRVMLNEGSEPEPWCPPGLNSVGDGGSVKVVTAGKNLFTPNSITQIQGNGGSNQTAFIGTKVSGIPAQQVVAVSLEYRLSSGAGTMTVQQVSAPYYALGIAYLALIGDGQWHKASGNVTVNDGFNKNDSIGIRLDDVTGLLEFRNIQFELGSAATDYEPPNVTTTPIDLDGHALNSLPDGTRDELRIDGTGAVTLVQRVGVATAPTAASGWTWSTDATGGRASFGLTSKGPTPKPNETSFLLCDKLPVRKTNGDASYAIVSNWLAYAKNPAITSTATAATVAGGATYLYPLATPQTIPLTSVTLPSLPGPTANVWAVATGGHGNTFTLQPEIELEYARDVTLVIGSLEAKVAALELLHETE